MSWWSCGFQAGVADQERRIQGYEAEVQDLQDCLAKVKQRPQLVIMVDQEQRVQPRVADQGSQTGPGSGRA